MNTTKLIKYVYIVLCAFSFMAVAVTNTHVSQVLPAIFLVAIIYLFFAQGIKSKRTKETSGGLFDDNKLKSGLIGWIFNHKLSVLLISIFCSVSIAYFYTGSTPVSVFMSLIGDNNLYKIYQQYAIENKIAIFSIAKLPYILMNAMLNFLFVGSVIICFMSKKIKRSDIVYLVCLSFVFWYFGLARGTNFEIFEIGCLFLYAYFLRCERIGKRKLSHNDKKNFMVSIIILLLVFSFFFEARGTTGTYVTDEIHYSSNKFLPSILPGTSLLISKLTSYFAFGFYYISAFFLRVLVNRPDLAISSIVPFGFKLSGESSVHDLMAEYIHCGANWRADAITVIGDIGFFGLFIVVFLLGRIYKTIQNEYREKYIVISKILGYYVFLQMFSFPVGNFIVVSSANKIVILLSCCYLGLQKLKFKR